MHSIAAAIQGLNQLICIWWVHDCMSWQPPLCLIVATQISAGCMAATVGPTAVTAWKGLELGINRQNAIMPAS